MSSTYKSISAKSTGINIISNTPALSVGHLGNIWALDIDTSQLTAQQASSVVNSLIAGETISALKVVYYDHMTGRILKSSTDDIIKASGVGVTRTAGIEGSEIEVVQYGLLSDPSFNFLPAQLVFLSDDGSLTTSAPNSGFLTRVGRAINENTLLVLIESPVTL